MSELKRNFIIFCLVVNIVSTYSLSSCSKLRIMSIENGSLVSSLAKADPQVRALIYKCLLPKLQNMNSKITKYQQKFGASIANTGDIKKDLKIK